MQAQHVPELPMALYAHILTLGLSPNERALTARLVCTGTAVAFRECSVCMSQPLPSDFIHLRWAMEAGQEAVEQLGMCEKLHLTCTAAASGCETNLEVATALLQSAMFPECFRHGAWLFWPDCTVERFWRSDPGVAAAAAGHYQLMDWLVRFWPGLVDAQRAALTAVQHGGLVEAQKAWVAFRGSVSATELLRRAVESSKDALIKMDWIATLQPDFQTDIAVAAARSGDIRRLQWLLDRGCPIVTHGTEVLESALRYADLDVARWLVDVVRVPVPPVAADEDTRRLWGMKLLVAAAESPHGVDKVLWLCDKGVQEPDAELWCTLVTESVRRGHAELARHVLNTRGRLHGLCLGSIGRRVGSLAAAQVLTEFGVGKVGSAVCAAAGTGDLAVFNALVEAEVLPEGVLRDVDLVHVMGSWPGRMGWFDPGVGYGVLRARERGLLEVVQKLVAAGCSGWDAEGAVVEAARRGHLELVRFLLQEKSEYRPNWRILCAAVDGGRVPLVKWLVGRYPGCLDVMHDCESPYISAAQRSDVGMLTAMRRLGVPWGQPDLLALAVSCGCDEVVLHWLAEQRVPAGSAMSMAVALDSRHSMSREAVVWLQRLAAMEDADRLLDLLQ